MKKLFSIVAVTAFSVAAFSQKTLSVDEAWQYAMDNNANLKKLK